MFVRNPFVWLCRLPRSRGYGIHSPFAYQLVTQVLDGRGEYYAYRWLVRLHPWYVRWLRLRPLGVHRLLFRLANHWQPGLISAPDGLTDAEWNYLHEGCRRAVIDPGMPRGTADMLLLKSSPPDGWQAHVGEHTLLVVLDLQCNRPFWHQLLQAPQTRVSFDLYDVGLAFFDTKLQRQEYISV